VTRRGAVGLLACAGVAALMTGSPTASAQGQGGPTDGIVGTSDGKNLSVVVVNLSGNGYRPGAGSSGGNGGGGGSVRVEVPTPCFWTSGGGVYTGQKFYDHYYGNGRAQNFGVAGLDLPPDEEIEAHRDEEGTWYFVGQDIDNFTSEEAAECDGRVQRANGSGYVFVPAGQEPPPLPAAAVPAAVLAEIAYDNLAAPNPVVERNPAGSSIVQLPTWFWVGDDPGDDADGFVQLEVTATAGDNAATVTATPREFTVAIPGQEPVRCAAELSHTAWRPGADEGAACTVVPNRASVGQPQQAYAVRATTSYGVAWTGVEDGAPVAGGPLVGVETAAVVAVPVAEIQAVVRDAS
jgi:hypothetical protein